MTVIVLLMMSAVMVMLSTGCHYEELDVDNNKHEFDFVYAVRFMMYE